jgi:hypothetical protein
MYHMEHRVQVLLDRLQHVLVVWISSLCISNTLRERSYRVGGLSHPRRIEVRRLLLHGPRYSRLRR